MNETPKEKFDLIFNSLNSEENLPFLDSILNNEEFNLTKIKLSLLYKNKIDNCEQILNELRILSEKEKVKKLENFQIVVESTPKTGLEKEFKNKVTDLQNCYQKFQKVNFTFSRKDNFIKEFLQKGFDNCIKNNCEKLINTSEESTKNCIRDCFKFNQYNSYIMVNIINDEILKLKNEIEKF